MIPIAISLFIKNAFGWLWLHKRLVAVIVGVIALVIVFGLVFRSCSKPKVVLNESQIQAAKEAIAVGDKEALEKIYVEVKVENTAIDANVSNGSAETIKTTQEAKKEADKMTVDELAEYLEGMK